MNRGMGIMVGMGFPSSSFDFGAVSAGSGIARLRNRRRRKSPAPLPRTEMSHPSSSGCGPQVPEIRLCTGGEDDILGAYLGAGFLVSRQTALKKTSLLILGGESD